MLCIVAAVVLATPAEPAWERVGETDGVQVWSREVPGGRVREVKAETSSTASPAQLLAVLQDVEHYREFMPHVVETRVLEKLDDGHYEYQRIDPPVASMRDYTVKVSVKTGADGTLERVWSEANDKGPPPREGAVRLTVNRGSWKLQPKAGGTLVTYHVYIDPGGSVPGWLANKANRKSVPELLTAVKKRAQDASRSHD